MQPVWKIAWQFLIKLNINFLYDTAISLLDVHLKEMKIYFTERLVQKVYSSSANNWNRNLKQSKYLSVGVWVYSGTLTK